MFVYKSSFDQLPAIFTAYAKEIKKPLEDVLLDQAAKLSSSDFSASGGGRGLFQVAADLAPSMAELFALPLKLNWRIKRKGGPVFTLYETRKSKRGKTAGQVKEFRKRDRKTGKNIISGEIERRAAKRFYHASGWLVSSLSRYQKAGKLPSKGQVSFELEGDILKVTIINPTTAAGDVVEKHGNYVEAVLYDRMQDMLDYLERKWGESSDKFNKLKLPAK